MIRCLALLIAVALPVFPRCLPADELRFDHVERTSVEDGLAHSTVWDVHQDRRGFLWFATAGHLNRYDGYQFKTYRHDPDDPETLSASEVMVIHEGRQGSLWLGTRGRGLNRFVPSEERFERYEHDPEDPGSLLGNRVRAVLEDRSGALWVGTYRGLSRLSPDRETFTHCRHDSANPDSLSAAMVWALLEDRQGRLWVGTWGGGLDRYQPGSGVASNESHKFVHYRHDPADPRTVLDDKIYALHEDRDGELWVGTKVGLNRFDRAGDLDRLDAAAEQLRLLLDELFELSRVGIQVNPPRRASDHRTASLSSPVELLEAVSGGELKLELWSRRDRSS